MIPCSVKSAFKFCNHTSKTNSVMLNHSISSKFERHCVCEQHSTLWKFRDNIFGLLARNLTLIVLMFQKSQKPEKRFSAIQIYLVPIWRIFVFHCTSLINHNLFLRLWGVFKICIDTFRSVNTMHKKFGIFPNTTKGFSKPLMSLVT